MKKLIFALVLALCSIGSWAETVTVDGIKYTLDGENAVVQSDSYSGDIVIPESFVYDDATYTVTGIAEMAFSYCTDLTSITIPNSVTDIGERAFYWCDHLTSVTLSESLTSIGDYVFAHCEKLSSITIPNSVTGIGTYAFGDCYGLTSFTIPESVTSLGDYAFMYCANLKEFINFAKTPQSIGYCAFYNVDVSKITLYVLDDCVDAYKSADKWKEMNIIGFNGDGIERINDNDNLSPRKVIEDGKVVIKTSKGKYTLSGQRME